MEEYNRIVRTIRQTEISIEDFEEKLIFEGSYYLTITNPRGVQIQIIMNIKEINEVAEVITKQSIEGAVDTIKRMLNRERENE